MLNKDRDIAERLLALHNCIGITIIGNVPEEEFADRLAQKEQGHRLYHHVVETPMCNFRLATDDEVKPIRVSLNI
jgi:hypothetical protein